MRFAVVFLAFVCVTSAFADVAQPNLEQKDSRIVSGWTAQQGQFPYMIYLRGVNVFGHVYSCAGSIIHRAWGLTSGRCVAQRVLLMLSVGMVNIHRPLLTFETSTYFTSPEYLDELQPISQPFDIGLIGFNRDIPFNNFIQPIRLARSADSDRNYNGVKMTTSGWGVTWTQGQTTDDLNWVHLTGITNFVCLLVFNSNFLVRSSTICAAPYNVTSQSICSGDSGVPLTAIDVDGQISQVGVGSFVSQFGCHVGMPSAFVRPAYFHDWIRDVTGINFDW